MAAAPLRYLPGAAFYWLAQTNGGCLAYVVERIWRGGGLKRAADTLL